MTTYHTYILYSNNISRFYIGSSSLSLEDRLNYHLSNHKGFTAKAKDWKIVFTKEFNSVHQARSLERKIKKRGSKRFLNDNR